MVTEAFLEAGIPLHKLDTTPNLRSVLEAGGNPKLAVASGLRDYIPRILSNHQNATRSELSNALPFCSTVFDGATNVANATVS